ncbi:cutinase family protein [Mycobacterium xenopi 3993]|nr:cutinase family protein [Mycobacterium xenopi 3993]
MTMHDIARMLGIAGGTLWALVSAPGLTASAHADQCPDTEVVFARGTGEPPGVGGSARRSSTRFSHTLPGDRCRSTRSTTRQPTITSTARWPAQATLAHTSKTSWRPAPRPKWCSADIRKALV